MPLTYHTTRRRVAINGSDSVDITASIFAENGYTKIIIVNVILLIIIIIRSQNSSVGIATRYGLDDRVRVSVGSRIFSSSPRRPDRLCSRPAALYPQEDSWYSFLLEAESTPGS
jgi:hypothetical protein